MWKYNGQEFSTADIPEGAEGFVYIITDNDGKKYIGQKRFFSKRKLPPLKGKTRKRTKIVESDWKSYFGSSENVKALLEERGPEAFEREVLHICFLDEFMLRFVVGQGDFISIFKLVIKI